jgi:dihydrolipoamide dehydrogenase
MKTKSVTGLTKGVEHLFKKNKVKYIKGWGGFVDPHTLTVRKTDGSDEQLTAKNVLIATGSIPTPMPGNCVPFDRERIISSTGALGLPEIPKKLVVIGAGVIGLEMASVYNRLGSDVTIVEFLPRICPGVDGEIAGSLQKILTKQGVKFMLGTKVTRGENMGDHVELEVEKDGSYEQMTADYVLVAIGRSPNLQDLNLESVGIELDTRGRIDVTEDLQVPNHPHIYACGDAIRGPMLAHKAEEEGIFVAELSAGHGGHLNYEAIPGVIYCHPEVA